MNSLFFKMAILKHLLALVWLIRAGFLVILCVISYLAFTPSPVVIIETFGDKACHFAAFFVLSLFLDFSYPKQAIYYKIMFMVFYGGLIELIQQGLGYRAFEWLDLVADAFGVFFYACLAPFLLRYRRILLHRR